MRDVCAVPITTMGAIISGAESAGGLSALIVKKLRLSRARKSKIRLRKQRGRKMKTNPTESALNIPRVVLILDCENLDEAIEWASKIPTACCGREGSVEIRPIRSMTL